MERPNRPPDFSLENYEVWIEEGIEKHYNTYRHIKIKDGIFYYEKGYFPELYANSDLGKKVYPAYKKWLISKHLKEKLK